uniref:Uncharacterized protein n=1 Tax=Physcomitrium patens TaxID=3218 RepID=A0A2K1JM37_PHYPA|nr:hypothetical protein PHYPA_017429 [Physcomitrium patens]
MHIHPKIHHPPTHCSPLHPSIHPSIHSFICTSTHIHIHPTGLSLTTHPSVHPTFNTSILYLIHPSIHPSIHPPTHPFPGSSNILRECVAVCCPFPHRR